MNEEDTTQAQDAPEENGETSANVEETSGGEQDVLTEETALPTEIPPVPSVQPQGCYRYPSRRGTR